jgi:hypothetical protein
VATTGYGDLHNGGPNALYTGGFNGTSSASPVVAGAAALLSSVIEARTGKAATPGQIRTLLKTTGTPQVTGGTTQAGNIGPLPDVARALDVIVDTTAPTVVGPYQNTAPERSLLTTGQIPTLVNWSAKDANAVTAYSVKMKKADGLWTKVTLPTPTSRSAVLNLVSGTRYQFAVAARDAAGNWSAWKNGATFTPTSLSETSTALSWSSGWTRVAWSPAAGGYVRASSTGGAKAKLTFTGRGVAWVGATAPTRGRADIYLDGVYQKRIDLYSSTTHARRVVYSKSVTPGVSHTLEIRVVATSGRPRVDVDGLVILK